MTLGELLNAVEPYTTVVVVVGNDKDEITAQAEVLPHYLVDTVIDAEVDEIVVDHEKLKVWCELDEDT